MFSNEVEVWIYTPALFYTVAILFGLLAVYYLWRTARMYHKGKRHAERQRFYEAYEAPRGQSAIDDRKEIEAMIAMDPDFSKIDRQQRRAMAVRVDLLMRRRARDAKREAMTATQGKQLVDN